MKKKVLATLLALSLLISLFSGITVSANNGQTLDATLTATPDPVSPDGTLSVTIGTTNWSQTIVDGILALDINLTYDATKLTYNSIALASNQTDVDEANITVIDTNGVLEITYYDATLAPLAWFSQGDAFVLNFTVKSDATENVTFSLADGNGANDSWIDNTLNPSQGAVVATYPDPLSVAIQPARTTYIMADADNNGVIELQDADYICEYLAYNVFPDNDAHFQIYADADKNGVIELQDADYICEWLAYNIFDETTGNPITIPN